MATRGELRDAFTTELTAVEGSYDVEDAGGNVIGSVTLDGDNIGLRNPEAVEQLPQIVYHEDYRRVVYNGVGTGPHKTLYNQDGSVDKQIWREYMEAQFIIDVRASNETVKEPIYEALRSRFAKYQFSPWDKADLHPDVDRIEVHDSQSVDSGDVEDVIRGDQIEVRIVFHRNYELDVANINEVNTAVDADNDGTVDDNYTTN